MTKKQLLAEIDSLYAFIAELQLDKAALKEQAQMHIKLLRCGPKGKPYMRNAQYKQAYTNVGLVNPLEKIEGLK